MDVRRRRVARAQLLDVVGDLHVHGPPEQADEASDVKIGTFRYIDKETFHEDALDPSSLVSVQSVLIVDTLTNNDTLNFIGTDSVKKTLDQLIDEYNMSENLGPGVGSGVSGHASVDLNSGDGTFVVTAVAVPEPPAAALLGIGLLGLGRRLRKVYSHNIK